MSEMIISGVLVEEEPTRMKVTLLLPRQWLYLLLYTLFLLVWLGLFGASIYYFVTVLFLPGVRFLFWFSLFFVVYLFVLYRLGRLVWGQWQFFVATRELLFLSDEMLIIRRPVSLLGITNAYDRQFVRPFFFREKSGCPAFEYGSRYVLFGQGVAELEARQLVRLLNGRYFPQHDDDDE
jgi:hypothetical protein